MTTFRTRKVVKAEKTEENGWIVWLSCGHIRVSGVPPILGQSIQCYECAKEQTK